MKQYWLVCVPAFYVYVSGMNYRLLNSQKYEHYWCHSFQLPNIIEFLLHKLFCIIYFQETYIFKLNFMLKDTVQYWRAQSTNRKCVTSSSSPINVICYLTLWCLSRSPPAPSVAMDMPSLWQLGAFVDGLGSWRQRTHYTFPSSFKSKWTSSSACHSTGTFVKMCHSTAS